MSEVIPIACDHGGYELKEYIKEQLSGEAYIIKDMGIYSSDSVDYPDIIHPLAKAVNDGEYSRGIIICGSGNGAQMTANKYANIRAALCWNKEITELARLHNDANILSLPGRFVTLEEGLEFARIFLTTDFEGGRHQKRIEKIKNVS